MPEMETCPLMSCQKRYIRHHYKEHFMKEHPEIWKIMEREHGRLQSDFELEKERNNEMFERLTRLESLMINMDARITRTKHVQDKKIEEVLNAD